MIDKRLNDNDVKAFRGLLGKANDVVLTAHVRPDGDAVGSTLGLARVLSNMGKNVAVVSPDLPPRSLNFVTHGQTFVSFSQYPEYARKLVENADLIICCDFNVPSRQDQLEPVIQGASAPKVLIDHHLDPEAFAEITFSYPEMSSTCELAFRVICALGLFDKIDSVAAQALLTGLITDTRNFTVNCSSPDIYEIMGQLIACGADKEKIIREALQLKSLDSVRLQAYAIYEKMEIFEQHRAAIITLDSVELQRFNYERGDSEGLVNIPLDIRGMAYCIFMREDPDCVKVSARSVDGFPVNAICQDLYGGGGHLQAAGGEFNGTLEECRQILINAMPNYDKYLRSTSDSKQKLNNRKK